MTVKCGALDGKVKLPTLNVKAEDSGPYLGQKIEGVTELRKLCKEELRDSNM
jgi:hypothetical protein